MVSNVFRQLRVRLTMLAVDESGMSTVEYANRPPLRRRPFGAILYTVVTGDSIVSALTNIITRALNTNVLSGDVGGATVEAAFWRSRRWWWCWSCAWAGLMAVATQVRCIRRGAGGRQAWPRVATTARLPTAGAHGRDNPGLGSRCDAATAASSPGSRRDRRCCRGSPLPPKQSRQSNPGRRDRGSATLFGRGGNRADRRGVLRCRGGRFGGDRAPPSAGGRGSGGAGRDGQARGGPGDGVRWGCLDRRGR